MVRQGDIIIVNLNPRTGHEQAGRRPAVVVSNDFFNKRANMVIACPITNTDNKFPLHIPLDERTTTTGVVLCEHVRAIDLSERLLRVVERLPDDVLEKVVETIMAEMDVVS